MSFAAAAGKVLEGRYRLIEPLGQGGMGMVWRAEHAKLKTAVAVKLIAPAMVASDEANARFLREAQVAASLESPNVVRVLDFGIEDDTPFLVMELLTGETLGARISRGPLTPEETAKVIGQVARGIGKAHQANVIHCDLKPENVFLAKVDGEDTVKVLDFGVAKAAAFDPVTMTGAVLGTLLYMSPEQLESRKNVGPQSDLYSLAVIAFECLSGRALFRAESIGEIVRKICTDPLPVPSTVASVPSGFDAWFARAAHRDPAVRFSNGREMSDALATALSTPIARTQMGAPVSSPRPSQPSTAPLGATVSAPRMGGTARAGFRVSPNPRTRLLEIELWGFWDAELTSAYRLAAEAAQDEMAGSPFAALVEQSRHPAQKEPIPEVKVGLIKRAISKGLVRAAVVAGDNAVGQMQRNREAKTAGAEPRFFADDREARAWLADADIFARRGGDERGGFSVHANPHSRLLKVERWGLWEPALAGEFKATILNACEELRGEPWLSLSIATKHPPQSPEVQAFQGETLAVAKTYGLVRAAMVAESALAAMMIRRLTQEAHLDVARIFTSEVDARTWLAELEPRTRWSS